MIRLDHYPEPVSPTGNIASEGIRNQLGRPNMDRLELFVRESVQNAWDARVAQQTVDVSIYTDVCSGEEFEYLKHGVLAQHAGFDGAGRMRFKSDTRLLIVRDRGTTGLGGPLRADKAETDEPHDFVDFLRDIGQSPDKEYGGGTYGYGKTALYLSSRIYTILVYSRCRYGGENQSRFMAAALGDSFAERGKKFTGRHWWGMIADDGVVDPLLDDDADQVAIGLGLPEFEGDALGTTIAILTPDLGQRTAPQAMSLVVHTLLWNFWPKMVVQEDGRPTMRFAVSCDGQEVSVPDPEAIAPFRGFVDAYRALDAGDDPDAFGWLGDVECLKPHRHLGRLALRKFPRQPRRLPQLASLDQEDPMIPERCRHVALLRVPELVVKYVEGPELHSEHLEYGGVFRAARDMDRIYAKSEPPSHDDWVNKALEDWSEKRYVGATFARIDEHLRSFAGPRHPDVTSCASEGVPLGRLSEHLSSLLPAHDGPSARVSSTAGGGGSGGGGNAKRTATPRAHVGVVRPARLLEVEDRVVLEVDFEISHAEGSEGTRVRATPSVVLDSGEREREPPAGSPMPEVLAWSIGGMGLEGSTDIYVGNEGDGRSAGAVRVSVPLDTTVEVELTVSTEED